MNRRIMKTKSKEARIRDELDRLSELFAGLEDDKRSLVGPLMQNAAFMRVTLEDLQEIIIEEGPTEIYTNGQHQEGVKQIAAVQAYNSLIKNYVSVIKSLAQYLPYKKTVTPTPWAPREKTEEELEAEEREREEHEQQIREEHRLAVEYQREQREAYDSGLHDFPSFSAWKAQKRQETDVAYTQALSGDD